MGAAESAVVAVTRRPKNGDHHVALLATADVDWCRSNFTPKLKRDFGIEVAKVLDMDRPNKNQWHAPVPPECDLVIAIWDSGGLGAKFGPLLTTKANSAGVPLVRASHRWATTHQALKGSGFAQLADERLLASAVPPPLKLNKLRPSPTEVETWEPPQNDEDQEPPEAAEEKNTMANEGMQDMAAALQMFTAAAIEGATRGVILVSADGKNRSAVRVGKSDLLPTLVTYDGRFFLFKAGTEYQEVKVAGAIKV
jgi:hypothetical protein